jgi:hypothetical protein
MRGSPVRIRVAAPSFQAKTSTYRIIDRILTLPIVPFCARLWGCTVQKRAQAASPVNGSGAARASGHATVGAGRGSRQARHGVRQVAASLVLASVALTALAGPAAADEFHDPRFQAEKGDPSCARHTEGECGASPQWLLAAKERATEANRLRLTVSRNAADNPTDCNVRIGKAAVRYLASGNDAFLFGLWLAQYHTELLQPAVCTMPVVRP